MKWIFINRIVFAEFSHFFFCEYFTFFRQTENREKVKIFAFFTSERNAKNVKFFLQNDLRFSLETLLQTLGFFSEPLKFVTHPFKKVWIAKSKIKLNLPSALAVVCLREKLTFKKKNG